MWRSCVAVPEPHSFIAIVFFIKSRDWHYNAHPSHFKMAARRLKESWDVKWHFKIVCFSAQRPWATILHTRWVSKRNMEGKLSQLPFLLSVSIKISIEITIIAPLDIKLLTLTGGFLPLKAFQHGLSSIAPSRPLHRKVYELPKCKENKWLRNSLFQK